MSMSYFPITLLGYFTYGVTTLLYLSSPCQYHSFQLLYLANVLRLFHYCTSLLYFTPNFLYFTQEREAAVEELKQAKAECEEVTSTLYQAKQVCVLHTHTLTHFLSVSLSIHTPKKNTKKPFFFANTHVLLAFLCFPSLSSSLPISLTRSLPLSL